MTNFEFTLELLDILMKETEKAEAITRFDFITTGLNIEYAFPKQRDGTYHAIQICRTDDYQNYNIDVVEKYSNNNNRLILCDFLLMMTEEQEKEFDTKLTELHHKLSALQYTVSKEDILMRISPDRFNEALLNSFQEPSV